MDKFIVGLMLFAAGIIIAINTSTEGLHIVSVVALAVAIFSTFMIRAGLKDLLLEAAKDSAAAVQQPE